VTGSTVYEVSYTDPNKATLVVRDCTAPALRNKTLAAARTLLSAANCTLGTVARRFSSRVRRGRIIRQDPVPGTVLAGFSPVNVVVSRGHR
jgi:beta-lactam-binding protein with PASTA domain